MLKITQKIDEILKEKNITRYRLCKLAEFHNSSFSMILKGKRPFPDTLAEKISIILDVPEEILYGAILADMHPKVFIERAANVAKNRRYKRKTLLNQNINKALYDKSMSQTAFATLIKSKQTDVNKMINGKISLSPKVRQGVSEVLGIPEDEIRAWVLADEYELAALEEALSLLQPE